MRKLILLALGASMILSACGAALPPLTPSVTPSATQPSPTSTPTLTPTSTITPTRTPRPTATTTRVAQGPGIVSIPILLYHHIEQVPYFSRYRVPPERFEQQIRLLHDWEYTTISTEQLVQAITEGTKLPPRPILITFDDGDLDVYENAFPIMQKYGFTGVFYLVANYVGQPNYISVTQVKEMAEAGWEIGSHSLNHIDLTLSPERQRAEVVESKIDLEKMLDVPVRTFAYPFGKASSGAIDYVHYAKYIAGMGLGYTAEQGKGNLFFLQRWEVQSGFNLSAFVNFLPWHGDPAYVPTDIPLATLSPMLTPEATEPPP